MKSCSPRKSVSFLTRQHENILLTGNRKGNVYVADFNSTSSEGMTCICSAKACAEESWLWHKKLSQLNFKSMNLLVKKNIIRGLPKVEFTKDGLCDVCPEREAKKSIIQE